MAKQINLGNRVINRDDIRQQKTAKSASNNHVISARRMIFSLEANKEEQFQDVIDLQIRKGTERETNLEAEKISQNEKETN